MPTRQDRCPISTAFAVLSLTMLLTSCLGGTGRSERAAIDGNSTSMHSARSLLTREELERHGVMESEPLAEILSRHRPEFLRPRNPSMRATEGQAPVVYVGRSRAGDLDVLRSIPMAMVEEVRFLSPSEARSRFGDLHSHAGGAIVITLRTRG